MEAIYQGIGILLGLAGSALVLWVVGKIND